MNFSLSLALNQFYQIQNGTNRILDQRLASSIHRGFFERDSLNNKSKTNKIYNYRIADLLALYHSFAGMDWTVLHDYDDVNDAFELF